jgi:hypothetical protein
MKTLILPFFAILILSLVLIACSKNESSNGKARLQISLTDGPGNYEALLVDVQDIRVNYSGDTAKGWQSLPGVRTGIYDILRLVNGKDTLLADAQINTGKLQQIRLVLGPNNFVKVNGKTYDLKTPSAQQSGLKLKISQEVTEGLSYKLLMDFDASRSVVQTANGKYILKPVIRTSLEAIGGSIKGVVVPGTFATAVYALQGADTVTGTTTINGAYMLKGLPAGNYNLAFVPSNTAYQQQTKAGIGVTVNRVTAVDTVRLIQ